MKKNTKAALKAVNKSVNQHNARVRRENDKFNRLTRAEKRVAIARDVLAQMGTGRFVAEAGYWLTLPDAFYLIEATDAQKEKNTELQSILKKREQCQGCALGGMFMCAVERANKLKVRDLSTFEEATKEDMDEDPWYLDNLQVEGEDTLDYLKRFFSEEQLTLIESAFEQGDGAYGKAGADFCANVLEASDRMRVIMQNIIVNKGKFCPEQTPVMVWNTWVIPGFVG